MLGFSRRLMLAALSALGASAPFGSRLAAQSAKPASAERIALSGYDPVAYFTDARPEKGMPEFSASFDGATYLFKNAGHRRMFIADPDRYAPQYQAWCAMSVSRGIKVEADPEAWVISDGKLYVFAAKQGVAIFRDQAATVVHKAQEVWPALREGR